MLLGAQSVELRRRRAGAATLGVVSVILVTLGDPVLRPSALLGWALPTEWTVPAAPAASDLD